MSTHNKCFHGEMRQIPVVLFLLFCCCFFFGWKRCLITKTSYSNILKILPNSKKKTENFQIKNSYVFHISAQNIDCGYSLEPPRRGGSNEYPQSMFS